MESAYQAFTLYMAAFGPATLSVIASRLCGRFLEHVSPRLGGWIGLAVGLGVILGPLVKLDLFIWIWFVGVQSLHFTGMIALVNAVAVAITCAVCFGLNHYEPQKRWHGW